MSDEYTHIRSISELIKENLITVPVNEKDKLEQHYKVLMKNSIVERILTKLIFQYKSSDYDLYNILNYFKEKTIEGASSDYFSVMTELFKFCQTELKKRPSLFFYSNLIHEISNFPKRFSEHKTDFTTDMAVIIENWLKDHIEANFFTLKSSRKIDDQYFNETFIKQLTERPNFDYSICALKTLFRIMKKLEEQALSLINNNIVDDAGIISEAVLDHYMRSTNKKGNILPKDIITYMIESHISNITEYLYDKDANINNYEIENKICLSLFLIKKLIKDYSFYFNKTQLENMFMSLKKFKE